MSVSSRFVETKKAEYEELKNSLIAAIKSSVERHPKLGHLEVLAVMGAVLGSYVGYIDSDCRDDARDVVMANFEMSLKNAEIEEGAIEH